MSWSYTLTTHLTLTTLSCVKCVNVLVIYDNHRSYYNHHAKMRKIQKLRQFPQLLHYFCVKLIFNAGINRWSNPIPFDEMTVFKGRGIFSKVIFMLFRCIALLLWTNYQSGIGNPVFHICSGS